MGATVGSEQIEPGVGLQEHQGRTDVQILAAIEKSSANVQANIEMILQDVNLLRVDLRKVAERSLATEQNVNKLQIEMAALKTTVSDHSAHALRLETQVEDA